MTTSTNEQSGQPHNGGTMQKEEKKRSFAVNQGDDQSMKTPSDAERPGSGHAGASPRADLPADAGRNRADAPSATEEGNATAAPKGGDRIDGKGVIDRGMSTGGGYDRDRHPFKK